MSISTRASAIAGTFAMLTVQNPLYSARPSAWFDKYGRAKQTTQVVASPRRFPCASGWIAYTSIMMLMHTNPLLCIIVLLHCPYMSSLRMELPPSPYPHHIKIPPTYR